MSKFAFAYPQIFSRCYQYFWVRYYFKYVLPKINRTTLEGIHLDLGLLPLKVRNRILNVGYEDAEKNMCRKILGPDDSVLELGGGLGFIGLFCQKKLGVKNYITVEANPKTVQLLKRNYELNEIHPTIFEMALGKSDGKVELNIGGDFWDNFVVYSTEKSRTNTVSVPSATLPSLLEKTKRPINALIIDIEGAEQFISFEELPDAINKIIIELHPQQIGEIAAKIIVLALVKKGFKVVAQESDTFALVKGALEQT